MTDWWIVLFALWLLVLSSNSKTFDEEYCELSQLDAPLGSSVLIPCKFSRIDHWVEWSHSPGSKTYMMKKRRDVVKLSANGRVKFQDPRDGRVKAFPIQATQGNYSICIYDLQKTDLGSYLCKLRNDCFKVELSAADGGLRENTKLLIYILICGAIPICFLCFYCYMQCLQFRQERLQDAMTLECEN
ncbi:uncharacterized protein PAE49_009565 isoform 1-T1 [Odontesthes bonariensis]